MSEIRKSLVVIGCLAGLAACSTSPGRTTAVSATTGGVLGAGLGAVVGSQTGDAGAGLVLGAVAGTSAGALVGNTIEGQEKDLSRQSELIRKQEAAIMSHRAELERLRRELGDDDFGESKARYRAGSNAGMVEEALPLNDTESEPRRGTAFRDKFMAKSAQPAYERGDDYSRGRVADRRDMESRDNRSAKPETRIEPVTRKESSRPGGVFATRAELSASHPANRFKKFRSKIQPVAEPMEAESPREQQSKQEDRPLAVARKEKAIEAAPERRAPARAEKDSETTYVSPRLLAKKARQIEEVKPEVKKVAKKASKSDEQERSIPETKVISEAGAISEVRNDGQCSDARKEVETAHDSDLSADKLFHLRRALRLCPNQADYHVELASLYSSLGRSGDAAYEFHEALRLEPDNAKAREGLKSISSE